MTYIGKKPENITASVDAPSGTFSGEVDAGSLDISGNADIDGTLEADAITINGTAIASVLSPIAGSSSIVTTGALNAGSITSGFGNIDTGSSTITTTGAITGGTLTGTLQTAAQTNITSVGTLTSFRSTGIDDNADALAMTIDSSENVLIGKTTTALATAGLTLGSDGFASLTRSGAEPLSLNRLSSHGGIAVFYKDGTTVGQIDSSSGNLLIRTSGDTSGIRFDTNSLTPFKNGSQTDNAVDLGFSNARFKDLYLSGGVFLGGTGSANKLDDYEKGVWTPVLEGSGTTSGVAYSRRQGRYTKVGDKVFVNFHIVLSNEGSISSTAKISGLPFSGNGEPLYQVCHIMSGNMALDKDQMLTGMQYASNAFIYLMIQESDLALSQVTGNGSFKDNSEMVGMCTYYTNS